MSRRHSSMIRGPRPVTPTSGIPAALTRRSTSWLYPLTVSSERTSVPSRSVAMSLGRPGRVIGSSFTKADPQGYSRTTNRGQLSTQNIATAEERLQRGGNPYLAVRLLVVLQDRDEPAGGCQGAVEGRRDLGLAVLVAVPDVQAARLERGAVRGRGDLAVPALGRYPGLAVVLAGR